MPARHDDSRGSVRLGPGLCISELEQMNPEATLLYYEKPSPCDERLTALAELLGAPCKTLAASALHSEFDRAPDHQSCILASASTISHWCRDSESQIPPLDLLRQKSRFLFVYGFSPENDAISIAAGLTNGQISDVRRFERADSNYEVSPSHPQLTRDFSGLSFGPIQQQFDFGFACSFIRKTRVHCISYGV